MAQCDGSLHGDAVDDASVEHGRAVDIGDGGHEGEAGRGQGETVEAGWVARGLGEVVGTAREAVGRDHLEGEAPPRIAVVGVVVVGDQLVGEALVEQVGVEDAARVNRWRRPM